MIIKSELSYNNREYWRGKVYIAEIIGENKRFGFEKRFLSRDCSTILVAKQLDIIMNGI